MIITAKCGRTHKWQQIVPAIDPEKDKLHNIHTFIVLTEKRGEKKKYRTDEKICMRFVGMDCGVSALLSEASTAFLLRKRKREKEFYGLFLISLEKVALASSLLNCKNK